MATSIAVILRLWMTSAATAAFMPPSALKKMLIHVMHSSDAQYGTPMMVFRATVGV